MNDLPKSLKNEIEENKSFFDNFDGKSLDEQQRISCVLNDCDLEIIAGAGTGKTHTLLAKAAYLIEKKNISPNEILFLSFSKSCVEELIERLNYDVPTSTIHAFGLSLIDEYREKEIFDGWGFRKIFDEYLESASDKQISDIKDYCMENLKSEDMIKLIELDTEVEKFNLMVSKSGISSRIRSFIDLFKGKGYGISDFKKIKSKCKHEFETREGNYYTNENYLRNMSFIQLVEPVYRFYESYLHRNHLIDFNDMINKAVELIENEGISYNFKYIFVDEYQDMSYKNFQFIKALKEACNANLVVVGDNWQSIYGFRDSDISLFNDFCDYFPNANRVFIEKTYRNPQELIDIAGKFIMKNDSQFKKSLKSDSSIEKSVKIVYDDNPDSIYNLINNLSKDSERVFILGRHNGDIKDFIFNTDLVIKSKKEYKQITNSYENINNVEYRTVHKAKGLEADYVVLINVFDQQVGFPNKLYPPYFMNLMHDWDYDKKLEEERRLFYVAITRAKKGVYIFTKSYKQSEYVSELIEDNDLDLIYRDDITDFEEFKEIRKKNTVHSNSKSQIVESFDFVNSSDIEIKANLKELGNKLMKSKDYDEAEDFYKKLITNKFFLNDYYPYRKLVEVYKKKKESYNVVKTIDEFFKSEIYCNNAQILWFKLEFKNACKYTNTDFNQFSEYLAYFHEHGINNIDKQNDPVPIAARIKSESKVISQLSHDLKSQEEELNLNYKFARKYESSQKTLYYFEQLWQQEGFNHNLTAYKRLCSFYNDTKQYEKVIEIANEYFKSDARRTKTSPDWFKRKIKKAEEMLSVKNDYSTNEVSLAKLENISDNDKLIKSLDNLSFDEKIDLKIDLYLKGKELLENHEYGKAIEFYKDLINNELFINDYHPFLKLSQAYHGAEEYNNEVKIIEDFFKSGRYCRNSTIKWFKKKLKNLSEMEYYDYSRIDELENVFKRYGKKNRKLINIPVPLAGDIKSSRKNLNTTPVTISFNIYDDELKVPENLSYDEKIDFKYNLIQKGKRLMEENFDLAIVFYNNLLNHELFVNDYHPYLKLSKCYGKTKRYKKQIDCVTDFFKSGIYAPNKIYKRFKRQLKGLNTYGYYDFSLFNRLKYEFESNGALNYHLCDEPVLQAIKIIESRENSEKLDSSNEVKTDDFKLKNLSVYSRGYFNKLAKEIQSNPDFINDREISQHVENDFIEIVSDYDKINQKADLINQGRELEKEDKIEAIKFYDSLKTNDLFVHDYYPYRRQCILFKNKLKDDFKDLDTIIGLFNHEIYCNPHQYIWLHNKLLELIDKLNLSDYEIHKIDNLLKNYGENEEKYYELQNTPVPIAERIFKDENGLRLLSQEKYDFVQDVYYINELGVGYIRRGEYETAISYYLNLLENDVLYYQYHAYKQLGRICKEMNDPGEFKRLYERLSNLDE